VKQPVSHPIQNINAQKCRLLKILFIKNRSQKCPLENKMQEPNIYKSPPKMSGYPLFLFLFLLPLSKVQGGKVI